MQKYSLFQAPNFTPIDLVPSAPEEIATGPSGRLHVKMYRLAEDAITEATTDIELAREFIAHGELSAKSIQNSQKQLFRFLTWCREEAKKTPAQLNVADLNAYKEFLKNPPPLTQQAITLALDTVSARASTRRRPTGAATASC